MYELYICNCFYVCCIQYILLSCIVYKYNTRLFIRYFWAVHNLTTRVCEVYLQGLHQLTLIVFPNRTPHPTTCSVYGNSALVHIGW